MYVEIDFILALGKQGGHPLDWRGRAHCWDLSITAATAAQYQQGARLVLQIEKRSDVLNFERLLQYFGNTANGQDCHLNSVIQASSFLKKAGTDGSRVSMRRKAD